MRTVDFRRNELTNWMEILDKRPELGLLKADDVVLMVSQTGDQLVFLHGFTGVKDAAVLRSTRLRIAPSGLVEANKRKWRRMRPDDKAPRRGGRWNPLMLVDYAKAAGIRIERLKTYEEHLKRVMQEAKRALGRE